MYDNTVLTSALASLDRAETAKKDFAEGLNLKDLGGTGAGTYTSSTINDAITNSGKTGVYDIAASSVGSKLNSVDSNFGGRKADLQDQMISGQKSSLATDYSNAVTRAGKEAESLVKDVNNAVEAAEQAYKDDKDAADALTVQKGSFAGSNTITANTAVKASLVFGGTIKAGVDSTISDSVTVFVFEGKAYIATGAVGTPTAGSTPANSTLIAEYKNGAWKIDNTATVGSSTAAKVNGLLDVLNKNTAADDAAQALVDAKDAIAEAVQDVYVAENKGYEIKLNTGSANLYTELKAKGVINDSYIAGEFDIDLSLAVDLYLTKADKDGVKGAFSIDLTGAKLVEVDTGANAKDLTIGNVTINGTVSTGTVSSANDKDAATIATELAAKNTVTIDSVVYDISVDDLIATFTAQTAIAKDFTAVAYNFSTTQNATLPTTNSATEVTKGVTPKFSSKTADDADGILTALDKVEEFNELVEKFETSRDHKDALDKIDAAIDEVKDWLKDEGYKLQSGLSTSKDSDIIMFNNLNNNDSISGFGEKGKYADGKADYLVASKFLSFSLVQLDETKPNDTIFGGSADKFDVFAVASANGKDTILYFENEAAAGNMKVGATFDNFTKVTLTGVTTEDIKFADGILEVALA